MKKLFLPLLLILSSFAIAQNIAFDFAFVDAEDINAYDENLKTKFQRLNQNYIDDDRILGWHVWKVLNGAQTPFTHLAVTIYDMDKMDDNYTPKKWTEEFTDMTQSELREWAKKNGENRKIVFETQMVNVAEVLQEGVTTYPDIAVMNFMKARHDKYKSYEDLEKSMTKSIPKGSARKGWSLAKRIDRIGTDLAWTHFTVDWYDKYSNYLKNASGPSGDANKTYQKMMSLRDLTNRVVFEKFIFLNK
ncbi:MAG: hypothetical protein L7V85_07695 [Bacteroidia bacterium]|nr:hypothetical protein [Bacteroidia bacterium]